MIWSVIIGLIHEISEQNLTTYRTQTKHINSATLKAAKETIIKVLFPNLR